MAGRTLTPAQLDGIVHLVAASVQGLVPEDVTVIDESGRMLTATRRGGDGLVAQGAAAAYQQAVERAAEERIESLLATVVGAGKVVARVAATVDFARTERTEEIYDPDRTVVRESHAMSEETAGGPDAKAPMGTRPDAAAPRTERRDETQSFEVSKTTSRTIAPMGGVKALSVAVLIDGTYREQDGTRVFVPRTEDELARFRSIVASAVGISEERGDRLEVTSAPFQPPAAAVADPSPLATAPAWPPAMVLRLLGLGAIGLVLVLVVRPLVRALGRAGAPAQRGAGAVVAERESTFTELARQNATLAQRHPERAAELVRRWLVETKVA
jgi:flagellar M-ring protein FliF